jgi:competence protein ComEA
MRGSIVFDRSRRSTRAACVAAALAVTLASAAAVAGPAAPGKEVKPAPAASAQGVVNINTASEEQLCFLPRIGPAKARAIIARRTRQPFRSDAELTRVKGIGRKTYRLLRGFVTLKGETTLTRKARPERAAP